MEKIMFKKTLVLVTIVLLAGLVFVPNATGVTKISNTENIVINVQTNDDTTTINYKIDNFIKSPVEIDGELYSRILIEDETNILSQGAPDIPNICRSIIISDTAKMDIRVESSTYE